MSPKFVLAVLFCLVAGNSGYTYENDVQYQQRSLADQFEKIMDDIAAAISAGVDSAFKEFTNILNGIIELGTSIFDATLKIVMEAFEGTLAGVEAMIKKAKDLGIDVADCLGSNWDNMMNVPTNSMKNCKKCIDNHITDCRGIIEKSLEEIKSVIDVKAIWEDFKSCSGLTAPLCWTRVIAETSAKFVKLPFKIAAETAKGTAALIAKKAELVVCQTKAVAQSATESAELSFAIIQCIEKKIEGQNKPLISKPRLMIVPRIINV